MLTTTNPEEVVVLARSIRIDVLIGDRGDGLVELGRGLRLVQPAARARLRPDEPRLARYRRAR